MEQINKIFDNFIQEHNLDIALSFDMPEGYETAFGTYDPCKKTLFVNKSLFEGNNILFIFTLFHELWHAKQYTTPQEFDKDIIDSLKYVVLYNGICYKLINNAWQKVQPTKYYDWENVYKSLPYELNANIHAYFLAREYLPSNAMDTLNSILAKTKPTSYISPSTLKEVFEEIDRLTLI